ncbi:PA14 domain-containing protein [Paenibacillus swuensis]|uniref:PA14 domain-containing protein n=1 Tax=Paenibacillus swuensis TaxID=1178515 RepID=UPI0008386BDB|nr:PA14 domain-containing protein [Paenibacillus swuensis]
MNMNVKKSTQPSTVKMSKMRMSKVKMNSAKAVKAFLCMAVVASGLTMLSSQPTPVSAASTDISSTYQWKPLKTGAGGFVTGIDVHKNGNTVYARTDVGGAYRLNADKTAWIQVVTSDSMPDETPGNHQGVISLVSAPGDENLAYMAYVGSVYRSTNKGSSWSKTNVSGISGDANGNGRTTGERLAVDPANGNVVYYGTPGSGLYKTRDGGANWSQDTSLPSTGESAQGVTSVAVDAGSGTVSDGGVTRTKTVYASVHNQGIFRSDNGGSSWSKITGNGLADARGFADLKIRSGVLYVVSDGVWKYAGGTWSNISPAGGIVSVAVSPHTQGKLLAFNGGGTPFRSVNDGVNWTQLSKSRTASDVPWLAWTEEDWMSVGNVVFDPIMPDKLWFAQGIGVWTSTDINDNDLTWNSLNNGIEEMVSTDVVAPQGGKPVTSFWDRPIFYHGNPDVYPSVHQPSPRFSSGWDLDYSYNNPNFLVAAVSDHRFCCESDGHAYSSGYSTDGGQNWTAFPSVPAEMRFGNIAVAASDTNNIVYLPSNNKAPFYTNNRGQSWSQVILPGTENSYDEQGNYNGGSHFAYYLNRHVLAADTVNDLTFYLYHQNLGMFRSTNGGQNWSLVNTSLPKGWTVGWFNASLKSVPGKAGHLFLTFGQLDEASYSMYRSTDGGVNWTEVTQVKDATAIGYGKALNGGYPTIYAAATVNGSYGVWRSTDEGANWEKTATYPLGLYDRVTAIDGDKDTFGKVYVGFKGNSFVYGEQAGAPGNNNGSGTGLTATYWNGLNFEQWVTNRTENVNFDWGTGSPGGGVNSDNFLARWEGYVQPKFNETYTFHTWSDDGVTLEVNGQSLINKWVDQGPTEWTGTITLQAGQKYSIRLNYYEKTGGAASKLYWSSPSQSKEIIPASQLYTAN